MVYKFNKNEIEGSITVLNNDLYTELNDMNEAITISSQAISEVLNREPGCRNEEFLKKQLKKNNGLLETIQRLQKELSNN